MRLILDWSIKCLSRPVALGENVTTDQGYWSVHVSDQREIKQIFTVQQKPRNAINESSMLRVNRHAISRLY